MPRIFRHNLVVPAEAIDANSHASNVEFVRWMQDAAVLHSNTQGWTGERYQLIGASWFVRTHTIEFFQPAFAGQRIDVLTWVSNFRKIRSLRKYKFVLAQDETLLARAETDWVFVEAKSGQPRRIPKEIVEAFVIVPSDEEP